VADAYSFQVAWLLAAAASLCGGLVVTLADRSARRQGTSPSPDVPVDHGASAAPPRAQP